jgi:hypothetical protein
MSTYNRLYLVDDPNSDGSVGNLEIAADPVAAVEHYYRDTLVEDPPAMYAEKLGGSGTPYRCAIGDPRIQRFLVTSNDGDEYAIYFVERS